MGISITCAFYTKSYSLGMRADEKTGIINVHATLKRTNFKRMNFISEILT